ncbi:MAG: helicase HerA domain-containing protein [Promethearchaeota archaeon]
MKLEPKTEPKTEIDKITHLGVIMSGSSTPNHLEFNFQINEDVDLPVGSYVEIPIGTRVILGRVYRMQTSNEYYSDPNFIRDHLKRRIPISSRLPVRIGRWRMARTRIVGVLENDSVLPPEIAPEPGDAVYSAGKSLLARFLGLASNGLYIGKMHGCTQIDILLNLETLVKHHLAVLGSTGSGKSYTNGVIIEELLEQNLPVIVIDPHGEYNSIRRTNQAELQRMNYFEVRPKGYPTIVYTPRSEMTATTKELSIRLKDLDVEAMSEITSMSDIQMDLLYLTLQKMKQLVDYDIDKLVDTLKITAEEWNFNNRTTFSVIRRVLITQELNILGKGIDIQELVKPGILCIIDLSGDIDERVRQILAAILMKEIFIARKKELIPPCFIIIEEAHRFAPQEMDCYSKKMLRRLAREGRKFGLGVCITSQRLVGLDKDALSQCGSKIVLRIDSKTDLDYVKPFLNLGSNEELARLPFLPQGVGIVSGVCVRSPIVTQIRVRKSMHGGEGAKIKA